MVDEHAELSGFLELSALLTGFSTFELRGTGQAEAYLATLGDATGVGTVRALLAAFRGVRDDADDDAALERGLRGRILSDAALGPVARGLIKLWYVGTWHALPASWHEAHGTAAGDRTFVVSPAAYTEGLLWPAVGANPSGAKPFGYGTWALPPRVPAARPAQQAAT